jgi:hypothetical protein
MIKVYMEMNHERNELGKEIEKRERLIQIFLIIGGFFSAFVEGKYKQILIIIYIQALFISLLYYIFLTRTKIVPLINWLDLGFSLYFSFFLSIFLSSYSENIFILLSSFILMTVVIFFALLYPSSSETMVWRFYDYVDRKYIENPKKFKRISKIIFLILLAAMIIELVFFQIIPFFK